MFQRWMRYHWFLLWGFADGSVATPQIWIFYLPKKWDDDPTCGKPNVMFTISKIAIFMGVILGCFSTTPSHGRFTALVSVILNSGEPRR